MKRLLGQIPLGPSLGKQNVLAKEVYDEYRLAELQPGAKKCLQKRNFESLDS